MMKRPIDGESRFSKRQRLAPGGLGASSFLKLATPSSASTFLSGKASEPGGLCRIQSLSLLNSARSATAIKNSARHAPSFVAVGVIDALGKDNVSRTFKGAPADIQVHGGDDIGSLLTPFYLILITV